MGEAKTGIVTGGLNARGAARRFFTGDAPADNSCRKLVLNCLCTGQHAGVSSPLQRVPVQFYFNAARSAAFHGRLGFF